MNSIDLDKLTKSITQFSEERDWDQFHSIKNLSMALSVETSELLEIFQWVTESQSNEVRINMELKKKVEEEVADIFIYLLRIVHKSNIDLQQAVENKMIKNAEKYPIDKSKGSSKKYNEF